MLLKNKTILNYHCAFWPRTAKRPTGHARVLASRALPRAPGRNLGLGREFGHAPSPTWATTLAQSTSAVGSNRTAARRLRANEKRRRRLPSENPKSFSLLLSLSSPVCALSSFLSAAAAVTERASGRNNGAASPGAVAGPLAGVRVPQRVSAPPSSGLAAAPLWPDPGEQCPPAGPFFSPRAGVHDDEASHPLPLLIPAVLIHLFGFHPISRLGLGLGLGMAHFVFSRIDFGF